MKHLLDKFPALLLAILSITLAVPATAVDLLDDLGLGGEDDILEVDDAFQLSTELQGNLFIAKWIIAEGHYLYQDKMDIAASDQKIDTHPLQLQPGEEKQDPIFNKLLYVYHDSAEVVLPIANNNGVEEAVFKVKYQGCSEISGICYPPQTREISVRLPEIVGAAAAGVAATAAADSAPFVSEQDRIANTLKQGNTWLTIAAFFGAGLLLALTPCVFPMIPILMGIIVGQGENQTMRSTFILSLVYVLAMAMTYTVVGILVGLSGENIQAWFQNPWIIGTFVAIFIALSFSMFGFYELQMPASIQSKLTQISNSQQGGTLTGVAIMGFLSALIVGPCVTAPLVGALIYIAETGDAVLGGLALFALSMGMGAPLLAIGASAGKVLPKAGAWMDAVKAVFGVLLLGLGIWMLERVAPPVLTMALWAALLIVSAIYMGAIDALPAGTSGWRKLWKGTGILLLVYGIILLIGLASGGRDVFHPLKGIAVSGSSTSAQTSHLPFKQIKGVDGFKTALADAGAQGKTVMLDFYADWCVSCKEMELLTFTDPVVQQALADTVLLQADVTPNDEQDKALYKHFGIIGPPSIMFFDKAGNERKNYRVVGFLPADKFSAHVTRALE
ncbi:MAG: protein-disulfide reductase DsbD [Gammaproteobacteria bacterium]|nr:protein-disulfide reductase DsbD [Gammaproteobacteria bacterium]